MEKQTRIQTSYADAGVSIDAGDQFVENISPFIQKTKRKEVLTPLGGYAGLFELDLKKYPNPVLVSTTDGVGTKLKLAFHMQRFDTVGIDLVAMCVNDLICCGAEPLVFLDYYATGKLKLEMAQQVIYGMTKVLGEINCSLIGGETAEMPGMYAKDEFDLAGFAVGVVNKNQIINGQSIKPGDVLIGLASSGVHSNGFSLVRKILDDQHIDPANDTCGFDRPIGDVLLTPTLIYVNPILHLLRLKKTIKGIAHITGGGLVENVPRILSDQVSAHFERRQISVPKIFHWLQEKGGVSDPEMWRVFNMGIGLVLVVTKDEVDSILCELKQQNFQASVIGEITARPSSGEGVILE